MTKEQKNKIALFRYGIISPLVSNPKQYKDNHSFFDEQSNKIWKNYNGLDIVISSATIEKWYYDYKKNGFNALMPKERSDYGKPRKLDNDSINLIQQYVSKYRRMNAKGIYNALIADGIIKANEVSYATINRVFIKLKNKPDDNVKQMLRYECEHVNDVWCADSSFGLYLYKDNKKIKLVIIAFIDDASRLITSCKIFDADNIPNLLFTYKDAIEKFGVPKMLNLDNGSNYRSSAFALINAKLGVAIHYDPPKTPQSKAKAERFFRTLKDQWMSSIDFHDFHSIDDFQSSLDNYINKYNNSIHSSLNGLSPIIRFQNEINVVNYLNQNLIDEHFLLDASRKATFDSIIFINETPFQLPPKFSNRRVQVLYSFDLSHVYVIDDNNKIELSKVDKISNSKIQRSHFRLSQEDNF
jgi:hypothetical protein